MNNFFPPNISSFGGEIDFVFDLIFWIVLVWFVACEVLICWFLWRYRSGAHPRAIFADGTSRRQLAWILVPAAIVLVLDLGIDYAGAGTWRRVKEQIPPTDHTVRVTALQFAWEFRYPGPDGVLDTEDDLVLPNQLHIPRGEPIRAKLESLDVIHSFFIPNTRLKQDIVPGRTIDVWFDANVAGTYEIGCAELCGFGHTRMRGLLIVHDPESWQQWQDEHWPDAPPADAKHPEENA